MNKDTKKALGFGAIAGTIAIFCCVSPLILVLLGLTTVTAAVALGNNLFTNYKIYFIAASLLFLFITLILYLKNKLSGSLSGVRKNIKIIIVSVFSAILVYIFWYYFTTWLASLG